LDWTTVAVVAVIMAATAVRSLMGFGNALVAMPLLALFLPKETVSPLVALTAMVTGSILLLQTWRQLCLRNTGRLLAGAALGTPIGLCLLTYLPEGVVLFTLAVIIFSFSLYSLTKPRLVRIRSDWGAWVAGFIAGILGGAYNTNGPPIAIYGTLRGWEPERFRAILQGFFWPAGVMVLIGHASAGLWTREVFRYAGWSLPGLLLTMLLCRPLARCIPPGRFDQFVHTLLMATAVLLGAKALL
jgi:uncharacterized membrane protein YfcA